MWGNISLPENLMLLRKCLRTSDKRFRKSRKYFSKTHVAAILSVVMSPWYTRYFIPYLENDLVEEPSSLIVNTQYDYNFMSILVLQSSWWGRESWLLCLICLPGVSWWLSGSSSWCQGVVCGMWLWYFLIILTYYFHCFRSLIVGVPTSTFSSSFISYNVTVNTHYHHSTRLGWSDGMTSSTRRDTELLLR